MKKLLISTSARRFFNGHLATMFFLLSGLNLLQAQISETFSDGDFLNNPAWGGDTAFFVIDGNGWLKTAGPAASSTLSLSTWSSLMDSAHWSLDIELGFNPSSSNFVRLYLSSDRADLENAPLGYFIQLGQTGADSDSLQFFRQDGTSSRLLFTAPFGCTADPLLNRLRIEAVRLPAGRWILYADCSGNGLPIPLGGVTDNTYPTASWMGLYCKYITASRSDKFRFDNVVVRPFIPDLLPPFILEIKPVSPQKIGLYFNEAIDPGSAGLPSLFSLEGGPLLSNSSPDSSNAALVWLEPASPLAPGTYRLMVNGIKDRTGNTAWNLTKSFRWNPPSPYSVLITEVMPDPDPSLGLLRSEFVELYNAGSDTLDLAGWVLRDTTTTARIESLRIPPSQFAVLYPSSDTVFRDVLQGKISAALSTWPSLNNSGDVLILETPWGQAIHSLTYSDQWHDDSEKREGGVSLEMRDIAHPCVITGNWGSCLHPEGATLAAPPYQSLIMQDQSPPELEWVEFVNSRELKLWFSEPLAELKPEQIEAEDGWRAESVQISPGEFSVSVLWSRQLQEAEQISFRIRSLYDCAGNSSHVENVLWGWPVSPSEGKLAVNEVLFDPVSGCEDFLELRNNSQDLLGLKGLKIYESDREGLMQEFAILCERQLLLPPLCEVAFCTHAALLDQCFPSAHKGRRRETSQLPNWPDEGGCWLLKSADQILLDSFCIDQNMHHPLLSSREGVSLEKTTSEWSSNTPGIWQSAATTAGGGTPGLPNSRYTPSDPSLQARLELKPVKIRPGTETTIVSWNLPEGNWAGGIEVFDMEGRKEAELLSVSLLEQKGEILWNGTAGGKLLSSGIHLLSFWALEKGGRKVREKACLVLFSE